MKYADGTSVRVGDSVVTDDGLRGAVVASIDDDEFSIGYSRDAWKYLGSGVLVKTEEAGLIHFPAERQVLARV
jgi:hypothetical protein